MPNWSDRSAHAVNWHRFVLPKNCASTTNEMTSHGHGRKFETFFCWDFVSYIIVCRFEWCRHFFPFQMGNFRFCFFSFVFFLNKQIVCAHMCASHCHSYRIEQSCKNRQINTPEMKRTLTHKKKKKTIILMMMWISEPNNNSLSISADARAHTNARETTQNWKKQYFFFCWIGMQCACDRFLWNVFINYARTCTHASRCAEIFRFWPNTIDVRKQRSHKLHLIKMKCTSAASAPLPAPLEFVYEMQFLVSKNAKDKKMNGNTTTRKDTIELTGVCVLFARWASVRRTVLSVFCSDTDRVAACL